MPALRPVATNWRLTRPWKVRAANAYNAACYLARCSSRAMSDLKLPLEERKRVTEDYARRAVGHLRVLALERGFADLELS